jgi:hypothetical protein
MADKLFHHHDVHNPTPGQIPVPHGPDTGNDHVSLPYNRDPNNEKLIFDYLLKPDDSYTAEGKYWADLPWGEKVAFVTRVDAAMVKEELCSIARMMKKDPLSPVGWYFRNAVLPGAGLGLEGSVLIFTPSSPWG